MWEVRNSGSPAAAAAKSLQSCPTLCDPIDGSPPGSPVPGILQARTLEWGAIAFSNAGIILQQRYLSSECLQGRVRNQPHRGCDTVGCGSLPTCSHTHFTPSLPSLCLSTKRLVHRATGEQEAAGLPSRVGTLECSQLVRARGRARHHAPPPTSPGDSQTPERSPGDHPQVSPGPPRCP